MMKIFLALLLATQAFAYETGPADSVLRVPAGGTRATMGSVDLSKQAAVGSSVLRPLNGGADSSQLLDNCTIAASVGSNALTIALKDKAGSNPSATSPCRVAMRSSTVTSGVYNIRTVTGALSLVISSGSTLGHADALSQPIYVYLLDNSGTLELAASSTLYDSASVLSTTAEGGAGAADSYTVIYSTTARSNVPMRSVAKMLSTQSTAGTWAAVPTEISLNPFKQSESFWFVDANISGANVSLGTGNDSSYVGSGDPSLTLTQNTGSITTQVTCSGTNAPSGTTCSSGDETIGISFTVPIPGYVEACVYFTHRLQTGASGTVNTTFQIVETPINAQTISQEGKSRISNALKMQNSETKAPVNLCGTFYFSSAGQKALRLMFEQAVVATVTASIVEADADTGNGQRDIHWTVFPLGH